MGRLKRAWTKIRVLVLGGDIEETGGASFGDVEGDVDSMKDSDDSKEHSEQSENTEQLKSWT